jgi:hypothetical protein
MIYSEHVLIARLSDGFYAYYICIARELLAATAAQITILLQFNLYHGKRRSNRQIMLTTDTYIRDENVTGRVCDRVDFCAASDSQTRSAIDRSLIWAIARPDTPINYYKRSGRDLLRSVVGRAKHSGLINPGPVTAR